MTTATATRQRREAPYADNIHRAELRGRAAGVVVGAVFGLAWAASALSSLSFVAAVAVLTASVATATGLLTGARRLHRRATTLPASTPPAGVENVRRRLTIVVAAEWAAIIAVANILGLSGHSQWIPAAICAAVGLHFVPLARLFHVPLYFATAAALFLVAATTAIVEATGAPASLWQVLPGFGAAMVLWATSAGLLAITA